MDKKVLKLKLDPEKHELFRSWAFMNRTTMQGALEDYVSEVVESGVEPAVEARKPVKVKLETALTDPVSVAPSKPVVVAPMKKSPFKHTPDTCPKHNFVNVGGASRCMECGVML